MYHITVVSPVYNAQKILPDLVFQLKKSLETISNNYEIILVDDGSQDKSWDVITEIAKQNTSVKGFKLSRNFGQHYAITCGLTYASGEWIVIMDCDLQDLPSEIPKLYNEAQKGFEIVYARRMKRKDVWWKELTSKLFYKLFGYLTNTKLDATVANFGIYSKKAIHAVLQMKDAFRVFTVLIRWVGFNSTYVNVVHGERHSGKSNYSLLKLFRLAFDMIIAFSEKPLKIGLIAGMIISLSTFSIGIFYLVSYFLGFIQVPGYTSLILLISFSTGILVFFLGLVGLYIGKVLTQVKGRPYFIVEKTTNYEFKYKG
ncbi:MAG: glycosyltransferase family 2 protein [Cyclobacteriaceae bacterium]|nr:glycosyltransferase family 2 protein [Bacteroidia bacterium]MCX7638169.1 glycosyltransferase family 2 protein [Cyclobacteriaceae bacterium]